MVRKYFLDTCVFDPRIINEDQIPLHRSENAAKKTLSLKSETIFVKENYMFSREGVTCFTQLCSGPQVELQPGFAFKDKVSRTHIHPPSRRKLPVGIKRIRSH